MRAAGAGVSARLGAGLQQPPLQLVEAILADAIRRADSTDGARVRDAIRATRGFIGTGGVVNMSERDHMGLDLSAFRMVEIRNGDWALLND